jgi:uncharacterized protein affecting Mg2+/Co2+ transport
MRIDGLSEANYRIEIWNRTDKCKFLTYFYVTASDVRDLTEKWQGNYVVGNQCKISHNHKYHMLLCYKHNI